MVLDVLTRLRDVTVGVLFSPGSMLSIWSLGTALLIAGAVVLARRGWRPVRVRALVRVMLPRRRLFGASGRADIWFTVFGMFLSGAWLGGAVMSHLIFAAGTVALIGERPSTAPAWVAVAVTNAALWVAYEFAYYLDHRLSHKLPWLWAFHKVHHSAEHLSPLTIFRVHPVDSIVFYNIVAVVTGVTAGLMRHVFGDAVDAATMAGSNALLACAVMSYKHLHHSHAWIAFTGPIGRVILSPAHHQLHHSRAVEHHDRNFGETLGVFDWAFGTLCMPTRERQPLVFGVDGIVQPHGLHATLIEPFTDALRLKALTSDRRAAEPSFS